ncbi:dolichyl-phosphate-mannose--protein O-mannosyl transferase [Lipingzhangella halophila]|uniref:Polyprenol-phosphate-mannose--protein mannosyltransferase n=1 Tax=Lipingzhangella halophila TaxID=1783352 RepID=A0A7W7W1H8_9ACTN|nr:phospholipid carrier-dependent glycosyltransferase [Lipingzhangella halophila]MBB4929700.1 dolichyl-phosphate-mannose--protein O-mannosyl transferase [Lipingzhangella halophila]
MTTTAPPAGPESASPRDSSSPSRLVPPMPTPVWAGWLGAVVLALFAGALRFIRLGHPGEIYFDETYYAKDAYSLWRFGYEREYLENSDELLVQGVRDIWTSDPAFVVHPPLGKWLIAAGDWLWGLLPYQDSMSPEGWRAAAALFGALSVLLLVRIALRMTRSWLLGCTAGLIMALDGLHFTMSRIAMVDIFLTFWILAGFGCLVIDRDRARERLAGLAATLPAGAAVGWLGFRWWRIGAGVCLGLACGTKWSAVFFVAAFGLLTVAWDYGARRRFAQRWGRWLTIDAVPAFFQVVGVAAVTYVVTWSGWLLTSDGFGRQWGAEHSGQVVSALPGVLQAPVNALRSLLYYHSEILSFHNDLDTPHDYASGPAQWLIMRTPVAFYYEGEETACDATECSSTILSIGTPAVWWLGIIAVLVMLGWWVTYRDWRAGAVLLGLTAGWLPWFAFPDRTMFVFYALPALPFVVLAIVLMLGLVIGREREGERPLYWSRGWVVAGALQGLVLLVVAANIFLLSEIGSLPAWFWLLAAVPQAAVLLVAVPLLLNTPLGRVTGGVVYGVVLLLIIANFGYLYPVLSAEIIPHEAWEERMWFRSWI